MSEPRLSVVLLTWNEERNIRACLESLERQTEPSIEIVLVDAGSTDRTVDVVRDYIGVSLLPIRLEVLRPGIPIGEARNHGVALAKAPLVAFVSADAELDPDALAHALDSLDTHDYVFARQVHAPRTWSLGAAVRGLRYHYPDREVEDPLTYASNVAAVYKKDILLAFPFDPWANAAEDLLLARRAASAGYRPAYNPRVVVRHRDVHDARHELRKSQREGYGWALYSDELGLFGPVLFWGFALILGLGFLLLRPQPGTLAALLLVLWAPTLRRAYRRRADMPPAHLAKAVLASPAFDLVFLLYYLRGLAGRVARRADPAPKEMQA